MSGTGATGATGAGNGTGPPRDPGLQPERTRLAWRRTVLSATVAGVLALKAALAHGVPLVWVAGVVPVLLFFVLATRRARALAVPRPAALSPRYALLAACCAGTLALAAVPVIL
ncbi:MULTISPECIES: DUF202 domain-containing protein [unclassified Streptomyces]|uniref:DUF202 domain-containing protein n=1 Tax=unclassified Streptomyces TaxID=2593676 RepID=UPI00143C77D0|nr:DUF202 domain-containing protein [Streptomyces sp. NEAU-H3]NJA58806.1 DUF202 domain-containing protein [Streptomyces sp. NEAU-H3]